jgi:hypothetical protein
MEENVYSPNTSKSPCSGVDCVKNCPFTRPVPLTEDTFVYDTTGCLFVEVQDHTYNRLFGRKLVHDFQEQQAKLKYLEKLK